MSYAASDRPGYKAGQLASVVYCSRAVSNLAPPDLRDLLQTAQARNRAEAITGLMLYDENRFYQWLEGPAEGVARIMGSITRDPRHTEIRVLDDKPIESRFFADWDMKLATPDTVTGAWVRDVISPPPEITEDLRAHPDAAPALLVKLVPLPAAPAPERAAALAVPPGRAAEILRDIMLATVIPQLAANHGIARAVAPAALVIDPRTPELVRLLMQTDQAAAIDFIQALETHEGALLPLYATLLEPAARGLGDLWDEDQCSEFDVTLGLCRMQTAIRLMGINVALPPHSALLKPAVLIAPEPGEIHHLSASMDGEVLRRAGWSPATAYPATDEALQDLVANTWFDALDLSLSTAMGREHWLPRVAHTIQLARHASQNPALVVLVGGRAFVEQGDAGHQVGADAAVTTTRELQSAILGVLRRSRP
jgi:methanogenic corrinoid protein MtbC1